MNHTYEEETGVLPLQREGKSYSLQLGEVRRDYYHSFTYEYELLLNGIANKEQGRLTIEPGRRMPAPRLISKRW